MAIDVKKYLQDMAKEAGIADDKLQAALEVFGNEKVSKSFESRMLAQDDYSRNMDAVTKRNTELNRWYEDQVKLAQENDAVVKRSQATVAKYLETYGELPDGTPGAGTAAGRREQVGDWVSKKEYEEALANQGRQALSITKTAMWASADYLKRFNEVLDPDELEKFALSSGLPLKAAYEKYVEPKVQLQQSTSFEEKLKRAKEEGLQEGLSRSGVPVDNHQREPHPFFDRKPLDKAPQTDREARDNFVGAWNKAAQK